MIRSATHEDLYHFSADSPFFVRVLSLYESYGDGYDFVAFWVQEIDGALCAAIARFEDKFTLHLTDDCDFEELSLFLNFGGGKTFLFDSRYTLNIPVKNYFQGNVLEYKSSYISDGELYTPEIDEVYNLLSACAAPDFVVPEYRMFLSDVTHRRNMGKCTMLGIREGDMLVSSAMTVFETDTAVLIGAVATHPDHRRHGYSRRIVCTLCELMRARGKRSFVMTGSSRNTRFYQNSGFEIIADFTEIFT